MNGQNLVYVYIYWICDLPNGGDGWTPHLRTADVVNDTTRWRRLFITIRTRSSIIIIYSKFVISPPSPPLIGMGNRVFLKREKKCSRHIQ